MKKRLTREEAFAHLKSYNTPEHVIRHSVAVTETALSLAQAFIDLANKEDFDFNVDLSLIEGAGLVHDIARVERDHHKVGAEYFRNLGYLDEAEIVRSHMTYDFQTDPKKLKEVDFVCLGDRLVLEDQYVGLDKRMDYVISKVKNIPYVEEIILEKKAVTTELIRNMEDLLGESIDQIVSNGRKNNE